MSSELVKGINNLSELSKGWALVKLGEVVEKVNPGFPCGKHNQENKGVPHLRPMNITAKGEIDLSNIKYVEASDYEPLLKGQILFNNTNSPVLLGKTSYIKTDTNWAYSNHMTRICVNQELLSSAWMAHNLHYLFLTGYFRINCTNHVNQASITRNFLLERVLIYIPPLAEQHRIVTKIEELFTQLDAGVELLKKLRAQLKRYRQAVLKAAVEGKLTKAWRETHQDELEPASVLLEGILKQRREKWEAEQLAQMKAKGKTHKDDAWKQRYKEPIALDLSVMPELSKGWVWATVDQLASFEPNSITDGPFGSNLKTSHYTDSGPRVIRLQNIGDGIFVDEYSHISQEHFVGLSKHHVKAGDLVIAMLGERPPRACIIPPWIVPALVKADCARFSPNLHLALTQYLNYSLNAEPTRAQIASIVHGVGRPRLNLGETRSIALPLPPITEQKKVVEVVEHLLSIADEAEKTVEHSLRRSDKLRQSILKKAFEGKLVPQDPADEPADQLLERIKAEKAKREAEKKRNGKFRQGRVGEQLELI